MAQAKCYCCGASATAPTFEEATKKLNHAIGLSRGIKCGGFRDNVKEIFVKPTIQTRPKPKTKELVESTKYYEELKKEVTATPESQEKSKTENPESDTTTKKQKPKKEKKSKAKKE